MKSKVLYISRILSSYNDPILQLIDEEVDLTFAWILQKEVKETTYKTFQLPYWEFGKFIINKGLRKVINQYDVVIFSPDLRLIRTALLPFFPHKPKLITWSIGLHVSYKKKYDLTKAPDIKDKLFQSVQDHCDACIFYMPHPIEYWKKYRKLDLNKYFVAHNTVVVSDFGSLPPIEKRDKFLFVGTIYKAKGLEELIEAYAMAKAKQNDLPKLTLVGKGPEADLIKEMISEKKLENSVVMTGAIYDEDVLKDYFLTSLLCISPKQAGLSVQKSLGYGVPFVTHPDAITGGERFDIIDKENGFFYNTTEELSDIILKAASNLSVIEKMSINAREYYLQFASPEKMAQGVIDAVKFVMNKK